MTWTFLAETDGDFTDLNFTTAVWTWVAFAVTFLILKAVAWPRLLAAIEEREIRIAEGLRNAAGTEERARKLRQRQEEILEAARREAQGLLAESRVEAETTMQQLLAAAQQQFAEQRQRAKAEIGQERALALEELKAAAAELALEASSRLLKRELRDELHRQLAREIVEETAIATATTALTSLRHSTGHRRTLYGEHQ